MPDEATTLEPHGADPAGQRWQAEGAPLDVIDIVRQVDDGVWLVRTELGSMVEMTGDYIVSSYWLIRAGEQPVTTPDEHLT